MAWVWGRARGARAALARRLGAISAIAVLAAGCGTTGSPGLLAAGGSTVAFESIDGPPPEVFSNLVAAIGQEAEARKVSVVSREGPAAYRVRAYLSAQVERGSTSIAWVWDVYDAGQRRSLRISGSEPTGRNVGRGSAAIAGAWRTADEAVLRRIARTGLDRIAAFVGGAPAAPPAAEPPAPSRGPVVAGTDSPEAAGIVRTASAR